VPVQGMCNGLAATWDWRVAPGDPNPSERALLVDANAALLTSPVTCTNPTTSPRGSGRARTLRQSTIQQSAPSAGRGGSMKTYRVVLEITDGDDEVDALADMDEDDLLDELLADEATQVVERGIKA
jgi:hypothetical protein